MSMPFYTKINESRDIFRLHVSIDKTFSFFFLFSFQNAKCLKLFLPLFHIKTLFQTGEFEMMEIGFFSTCEA
jgi:hypothetical protein